MKKLAIILIALGFFAACKKDKADEVTIKGKWNGESIVEVTYENDILIDSDTETMAGTTFDFQENGVVVVVSPDGTESFPYSVESSTQLQMDGQLVDIKNLTSEAVTLSFRDVLSPTIYTEVSLNLRR